MVPWITVSIIQIMMMTTMAMVMMMNMNARGIWDLKRMRVTIRAARRWSCGGMQIFVRTLTSKTTSQPTAPHLCWKAA